MSMVTIKTNQNTYRDVKKKVVFSSIPFSTFAWPLTTSKICRSFYRFNIAGMMNLNSITEDTVIFYGTVLAPFKPVFAFTGGIRN